MRLPIRTKLTLVFTALMAGILAITGILVYRTFSVQLDQTINARLESLGRELTTDIIAGDRDILHDFGEGDSEGFFAQILDTNANIIELAATAKTPLLTATALQNAKSESIYDVMAAGAGKTVSQPVRVAVSQVPKGQFVVVGTSLLDRNDSLEQLLRLLWLAGPALAGLASLLAWLLASAALKPVERMSQQTAMITENNLTERVPVPETGDEIATLAITLNSMLARLEQGFERERRFVDDASHELRTPLGILKTELDLALRRARSKEELTAALTSAAEESERLNRIAEDLLVLARSDRGRLQLRKEQAQVNRLLHSVAERFGTQSKSRGVGICVDARADLIAHIDPARLEQALGNLIANALAHAPSSSTISVRAETFERDLAISVADNGPGFPPNFIERAFDPFTRADAGRSSRDGGAGLGLAIVKGVAEAHGGSVKVRNNPAGGAVVTITLQNK